VAKGLDGWCLFVEGGIQLLTERSDFTPRAKLRSQGNGGIFFRGLIATKYPRLPSRERAKFITIRKSLQNYSRTISSKSLGK